MDTLILTPSVFIAIGGAFLLLIILLSSVTTVPQNQAYLVERFGKYRRTLTAGLNFIVPFIDKIAARRTLKEQTVDTPAQSTITRDNISLSVDGVLYFRVLDPQKATYGVDDYQFAVQSLAQTTMRSVIGTMELDKTFEERESLNAKIVSAINEASEPWGVQALRYEIKDITPPSSVMKSMEAQMKAEREKRAQILESEGERQSNINRAEGEKQARVLAAEAEKQEQILRAAGEKEALIEVAKGRAESIRIIGDELEKENGQKAMQFELAQQAIDAKTAIAKESTVVLLPENSNDISSVVAQAMTISSTLKS